MPIDFPNAPNSGDTFTSGNRTWQFDSVKWIPASTSGTAFVPDAPDAQGYARQKGLWVPAQTYAQGYTNKFRNGTMDVWQRGVGIGCPAGTTTYTADGWIVTPTGAAVTAAQNANGLTKATRYALAVTGAAGVTSELIQHRLESFVSAPLDGQTVTFQAKIYQNSGATITPFFSVLYPNAADNWSGGYSTALSTVNLQPCPNNATVQVAYTFAMPASSAVNGLAVNVGFGPHGAWAFVIGECDLRATPGLAVGLQANPPPPELRPISEEMVFCQRYLRRWNANDALGAGSIGSATSGVCSISLSPPMRAAVTPAGLTTSGVNAITFSPGGFVTSAISVSGGTTPQSLQLSTTLVGATIGYGSLPLVTGSAWITASAEL